MTKEIATVTRGKVRQKTMRAMVQEKYGPASDVLEMREVAIPEIAAGEVLVRVRFSSVNAMEWHLINGKPYMLRPAFGMRPKSPTLGADVSGTVVAVGAKVTRFEPGDEVLGEIGAGAYAELAKAAEDHLVVKPATPTAPAASKPTFSGLATRWPSAALANSA